MRMTLSNVEFVRYGAVVTGDLCVCVFHPDDLGKYLLGIWTGVPSPFFGFTPGPLDGEKAST